MPWSNFRSQGYLSERRRGIRKKREREGRRVRLCVVYVWVGETRLRGACGGVGCVCVVRDCSGWGGAWGRPTHILFTGFLCLCFVHASAETLYSPEQRPNLGRASTWGCSLSSQIRPLLRTFIKSSPAWVNSTFLFWVAFVYNCDYLWTLFLCSPVVPVAPCNLPYYIICYSKVES